MRDPNRSTVTPVITARTCLTGAVIRSMERTASGLRLDVDGRSIEVSWTWLRDHARDATSFLADVHQRVVPAAVVAAAGEPDEVRLVDDAVEVTWPATPVARYEARFLGGLADPTSATAVGEPPEPWTGAELAARLDAITFDEVLTDTGLREALHRFWRDGVLPVVDVEADVEATRAVLERFGYIRETIFGGLWEYGSDGAYDDTASTTLEITPHTDSTYSRDAPGLLGLHCHRFDGEGAENVFVDAHALAARLSDDAREILSSVEIPGQYLGDGVHLMARRPVLRHEGDRLVQVSYNHHDRAPFVLPEPEMSRLYAALHEFDALAGDDDLQFELALRPGDMVLFDNWRVLHGRRAFVGDRRIAGAYVNREDVESTHRRLEAARSGEP